MAVPELTQPIRSRDAAELYRAWARDAALGLSSLAPAMTAAETAVSPPLARAAQATENAWRAIDEEFGLLSSTEAAEHMGYGRNRTWASTQRREGRLLGIRRGSGYRYPGFQLDRSIMPTIARLIAIAREHEWSEESVVLWLCSPSGWMPGDGRPVELLREGPEAVLAAARAAMSPQW